MLESEITQFLIRKRREVMKGDEVFEPLGVGQGVLKEVPALMAELELHITNARKAMKLIAAAKRILIVGYPLEASPLLVLAREVMGVSFRTGSLLEAMVGI